MNIDYSLVLSIINASEDPASTLRAYVEQEREAASRAPLWDND